MIAHYQESPQPSIPRANNPKAVESLRKLRIKKAKEDFSPEDMLSYLEKKFIRNFTFIAGARAGASKILPNVNLLQKNSRGKQATAAANAANEGVGVFAKSQMENSVKSFSISLAILYGKNPLNESQAFSEILGEDLKEYLSGAKKMRSDAGGRFALLAAGIGSIPQAKKYKIIINGVGIAADGLASAFSSAKEQREFAEELIKIFRDSLGPAPEIYPPLLYVDFDDLDNLLSDVDNDGGGNKNNRFLDRFKEIKLNQNLPLKRSSDEERLSKEQRKKVAVAEKTKKKAMKAQVKAEQLQMQAEKAQQEAL